MTTAVPVVQPLPVWLRQRYLVAGAAALVVAPMVWLVRNFVSDRVFYQKTRTQRSERAYQAYIKAGWLNVAQARQELPRVALDEAKRKRTGAALRDFLGRYPGSSVDAEARGALDALYRDTLESPRPSGPVEALGVDDLLGMLGRMDPARVNAAALARFIPVKPAGADCGKDWRARLPGDVTPAKGLLARALLRGACEDFLAGLVGKDRALLGLYRDPIEKELGAPATTTTLALRQMRDYGTVRANAGVFSPGLAGEMLGGIRRSAWFPETMPDPDQIEALKKALARDTALTDAVLDYMQQHAAGWAPPRADIAKDDARKHLTLLLEFSRQVGGLSRPALAAQLAQPAQAAFRAEIDAVAKKSTDEMVRFFTSGPANPLAGELVDKLAAGGKTLVGFSFVGEGGSFAGAVKERLASAGGSRLLVLPCSGTVCDRITRRVSIRMSTAPNDYCYDKYSVAALGICSNRGKSMTLSFTYLKDNQTVGSDSVSAETPNVVRYRTYGFDSGPSSSDVYSATVDAVNERLRTAKLTLPF